MSHLLNFFHTEEKKELHQDVHVARDLVPIRGKRRALLIGINYTGSKQELRGCVNDVKNLKAFLVTRHFRDTPEFMRTLTDDQTNADLRPTKANLLKGFDWLVNGAEAGDHLFFHYSGHGSQVKDTSGDEEDGFDETLVPVDYASAGQIVDDIIHDKLVAPLKKGVRLTAIFDCCHSGTVLDLPFVYKASGEYTDKPGTVEKSAEPSNLLEVIKVAGVKLTRGFPIGGENSRDLSLTSIKDQISAWFHGSSSSSTTTTTTTLTNTAEDLKVKGASEADIISISGCRDDQTSADVKTATTATGAMSWALLMVFKDLSEPTLIELLNKMRDVLRGKKFAQVPQMSTSHHINPNCQFVL